SFVAACRELAAVVERHLSDPQRALEVLRDALERLPSDDTLIAEAERGARESSRPKAGGHTVGQRPAGDHGGRPGRPKALDQRLELVGGRARWREDRLKDPAGALDEQLRAFALAPDRPELRDEILRLAELSKRFEDALACEATLFARAPTPPERFAIALRAA